jgi:hypothetical protein
MRLGRVEPSRVEGGESRDREARRTYELAMMAAAECTGPWMAASDDTRDAGEVAA